eukprot:8883379-Pyramimonas_sp.AAC.2
MSCGKSAHWWYACPADADGRAGLGPRRRPVPLLHPRRARASPDRLIGGRVRGAAWRRKGMTRLSVAQSRHPMLPLSPSRCGRRKQPTSSAPTPTAEAQPRWRGERRAAGAPRAARAVCASGALGGTSIHRTVANRSSHGHEVAQRPWRLIRTSAREPADLASRDRVGWVELRWHPPDGESRA